MSRRVFSDFGETPFFLIFVFLTDAGSAFCTDSVLHRVVGYRPFAVSVLLRGPRTVLIPFYRSLAVSVLCANSAQFRFCCTDRLPLLFVVQGERLFRQWRNIFCMPSVHSLSRSSYLAKIIKSKFFIVNDGIRPHRQAELPYDGIRPHRQAELTHDGIRPHRQAQIANSRS